MFNFNKMTIKAQEAVQSALELAENNNHQQLMPEHLLLSLIYQEDGMVTPLLQKADVNVNQLRSDTEKLITKFPKVEGSVQIYIGQEAKKALDYAFETIKQFGDEYVSTEHILLGVGENAKSDLRSAMSASGYNLNTLLKAYESVRGSSRVTDQNPEDKMNALDKYTINLTESAQAGKLDPVIGRDEEIRRVIHVLSRRTKKQPCSHRRTRGGR